MHSPIKFFLFFEEIFKETIENVNIDETGTNNPHYYPEFVEFLLTNVLAIFPLVTGILIKDFNITNSTNNSLCSNYLNIVCSQEHEKDTKRTIELMAENHFCKIEKAKNTKIYSINKKNPQTENAKKQKSDIESVDEEKMSTEQSLANLDDIILDEAVEVWMDKKKGSICF